MEHFDNKEHFAPHSDTETREKVEKLLPCLRWRIREYDGKVNGNIVELSIHHHSSSEIVPLTDRNIPVSEYLQRNHWRSMHKDRTYEFGDARNILGFKAPFCQKKGSEKDDSDNK
jgi:hypothetical protein